MRDLKSELKRTMAKVKAGNANKRGLVTGDVAPRVVDNDTFISNYPAHRIIKGKRVSSSVIRYRN